MFKACFILCLMGLTWVSCLDPIELEVPSGGVTDIVIDGKLVYGDPSTLVVSVSEIFDFDGNPNRISIRSVELIDEANNIFEIRSQDRGIYSATIAQDDPNITISPDQRYKIKVFLASGDIVESDFQTIARIAGQTSLTSTTFQKMVEEDDGSFNNRLALSFTARTPIPADQEVKLRWEVLRTYRFSNLAQFSPQLISDNRFCNTAGPRRIDICEELRLDPGSEIGLFDCDNGGVSNAVECDRGTNPLDSLDDGRPRNERRSCYITGFEDIRNIKLFDPDTDPNNSAVFEQTLFEPAIDFKFAEGYHVQLITEAINEDVFKYYAQIDELLSLSGSMFDPPAGKVKGNMVNTTSPEGEVFGIFYATEQDTANQFIDLTEVGNPDTLCLANFMGMPPETCLDCTVWANSGDLVTILRPSYWGRE